MHIQKESPEHNSIQSYTNECVSINHKPYSCSTIICSAAILSPWPVFSLLDLNETALKPFMQWNPEIILIGHQQQGVYAPVSALAYLSNQRVGLECMSIGAACRTFNILLSEQRRVVIGVIFNDLKPVA